MHYTFEFFLSWEAAEDDAREFELFRRFLAARVRCATDRVGKNADREQLAGSIAFVAKGTSW